MADFTETLNHDHMAMIARQRMVYLQALHDEDEALMFAVVCAYGVFIFCVVASIAAYRECAALKKKLATSRARILELEERVELAGRRGRRCHEG